MTSPIPPPPYKIVLLGESSVGKTSLVNRFTANKFNHQTANTIGAAFITKEHSTNNRKVKYEVWDTAGQERYRSLTPMYYRNARVALVCFDMDNISETLHTAKYWIDQLAVNGGPDSQNPIRIKLVGNKHDLYQGHSEVVLVNEVNEIDEFCRENGIDRVWKTSAKEGQGIVELFDAIVEEIEPEFFEDYYKQAQEQSRQSNNQMGFILNPRSPESKCC